MSDQLPQINGIVLDAKQMGLQIDIPSTTQSTALRQTLNPFALASSRNVRSAAMHGLPRPSTPVETTPFIYEAADQFFGIAQSPRSQSNDAVAQMIVNWLEAFPRSAGLYATVADRLNQATREREDSSATRYFEASLDPESTALFLKVLNDYEGGVETSVNYTDEELGLT